MAARILIVEDNAVNLELVRYLLAASGHTVLLARNGEEGLRVALDARPDLILCDLQMPVMDGYQMLARLREHPDGAGLVTIALTALSMNGDRRTALMAGFDGYIPKPIEPELFVGEVEDFLPAGLRTRT